MEYVIGIVLALVISSFSTLVGFDSNRAFYPVLTFVIATYYALFAVMGGSLQALAIESIVIAGFISLAVIGFKRNLWIVVAALIGHGAFDFVHGFFIENPGLPEWWPGFCFAYDVVAGIYLGWLLWRSKVTAHI